MNDVSTTSTNIAIASSSASRGLAAPSTVIPAFPCHSSRASSLGHAVRQLTVVANIDDKTPPL